MWNRRQRQSWLLYDGLEAEGARREQEEENRGCKAETGLAVLNSPGRVGCLGMNDVDG